MSTPVQTLPLTEKVANIAIYGGSGGAFFFGLTANEFAALAGVLIALVGLGISTWFKAQHLKIAREKARADPEE